MEKNIRKMTITTETGKDVKTTSMLSGEAKPTKSWKETNETSQYSTGSVSKGALGGHPSGE